MECRTAHPDFVQLQDKRTRRDCVVNTNVTCVGVCHSVGKEFFFVSGLGCVFVSFLS